jgi:hypothetical protein
MAELAKIDHAMTLSSTSCAVAGFGISVFWFLRGIVQKKKPTRKDLDKLKEAMVYRSIQLL